MGYKVHRKRRYYSRRKSPYAKVLYWVLAAAILIPGSFFATKWLVGSPTDQPTQTPAVQTTVHTTVQATTTAPQSFADNVSFRGFFLPYTSLADNEALGQIAANAAAAGFNTAVVELKDQDGNVYYISETSAGKTANAQTADALTLAALTEAFSTLKKAGISPVPLLYAFEDIKAPHTLPAAKVTVAGHPDWMWYDGDPQKNGRPWLNPYTDAAQTYITALAEELQAAGASGIMLDGVYFPTQTAQSDFTIGGDASLSKAQVLAKFVERMDTVCDIPVVLRCSANAALGNNTAGYDANPLTFGAAGVIMDVRLSVLGDKLAVEGEMLTISAQGMSDVLSRVHTAMQKRTAEIAQDQRPSSMYLLDGETVAAQLQALRAQDKDISYFVYNQDGQYDFAALSHTTG